MNLDRRRRTHWSPSSFSLVLLTVALALLTSCSTPVGDDPIPTESERARDFALPDTSGELWSLSSALQNGPVVLVFLRGHW